MNNRGKALLAVSVLLALAALLAGILRPDYFSSYYYLGALIFTEVMVLALWDYSRRFMPLLMLVFLWAGINAPLNEVWISRRWFVLAVAAMAGFVIYIRDRRHNFGAFHLVALSCVLAAVISAMVSSLPRIAILKALSLFLLFAYGATGARLAVLGREGKFFFGLLLACEVMTYVVAFSYFVIRHELLGNPNSLGAIMGVVVVPLLLWGIFVSQEVSLRRRRSFALVVSLGLLFASYARAGIAAAAIACILLCVALRYYKILIRGSIVALLLALLVVAVAPFRPEQSGSLVSSFFYKWEGQSDVLGSRKTVWDQSVASIRERPWFGTGFGTVATSYEGAALQGENFSSRIGTTKEHGNSYLAITEWVGLLGVIPFFILVFLVVRNVSRVILWLRRTGNVFSPAVPIAAILAAGLVHAAFEDWMFAVGYYLCVVFWSLAFILVDVLPASAPAFVRSSDPYQAASWQGDFSAAPTTGH